MHRAPPICVRVALGVALLAAVATAAFPTAAAAAPAELSGPVSAADGHARVSLITDVDAAVPGLPFWAGLRFELAPGWDVYWKNPGQSGMATDVTWTGDGVALGATRWPAPERIASSDGFIVTYGWHGDIALLSEARTTTGGTIHVSADFLVCEHECIPGHVELSRTVVVGDGAPAPAAVRGVMTASWARVPRPADKVGVSIAVRHEPSPVPPGAAFTTTLSVTGSGLSAPKAGPEHAFFPEAIPTVTLEPRSVKPRAGGVDVTVAGTASADDPGGDQRLAGVLALEKDGATIFVEVDAPLPRARVATAPDADPTTTTTTAALSTIGAAPPAPAPTTDEIGLLRALGLAFVGGLLLNLMPCVLPVLALKVGSLIRLAGERTADRARHAAAYAGGIVGALAVLAIAVLALRAAGTRVGWGFQFQEPGFLVVIGALLVVLAVNAFGGLELGLSADALSRAVDDRRGLARSAGEGVLAVVLATPCSAPFLGSAVGFALASPAPVVVATFVALGLGLATPVALIAIVPGARRLLPRPGAWMVHLKQAVGLALLAAAVWLAWIVGRGFGVDASAGVLAFWLAIAVAAWLVGVSRGAAPRRRIAAAVVAAAVVIGTGVATLRFDDASARAERAAHLAGGWEPWSDATVARHLGAGRAVFVDFTADWCLTCKVNERTVLASDEVRAALARHGVALLRADWTLRDDAIRATLARHGKAGVPMYLVYAPARPDQPEVLPEVLTPARVIAAVEAASR